MIKSIAIVALTSALLMGGCASDYGKYAQMQTDIQTAKSTADAAKYQAIATIGSSGDVTAKVASLFAISYAQATPQTTNLVAPKSTGDTIREWASVLMPSLVQGYGMYSNTQLGKTQSDNATSLGISTNDTFLGIAGKIQAPAANMTIGGDGVIGGGSFSAITESYNPAPIDNSNQGNPVNNSVDNSSESVVVP